VTAKAAGPSGKRVVYRCGECGGESPKWLGRCPACEAWGSLVEERERPLAAVTPLAPRTPATLIGDVSLDAYAAVPTGVAELDRVLGGGLVPGSVTVLGGEPGIGKSTLLLQVLAGMAGRGQRGLLVTAEESAQQVRSRADRLGAIVADLYLAAETSLPDVLAHVEALSPDVLVVDSIQTIFDPDLSSAPGSVAQVRDCAHRLVREAKERGMATVLVGHVTKEGGLAGPRVLEHLVDTVLSFEGERHHALRMLRAVKHRFGSTSELGLFEMAEQGLLGVPDPSKLFLADRRPHVAGSVVVPTVEGHRPLLVEVQALVTEQSTPNVPLKRYAQGLDQGRMSMLLAAIRGYGNLDVHVSAVGGVRIGEPGADLGIALAVTSARTHRAIGEGIVACGEVGLTGEVRQVSQMPRRLAEAARLGFTTAIVPKSSPAPPPGIDVIRVASVKDAIERAGLAT
jgi:DNA repair protein RadA/Sms